MLLSRKEGKCVNHDRIDVCLLWNESLKKSKSVLPVTSSNVSDL